MTTETGVFWLSTDPDNQLPGHLILPEHGAPIVELHGALTPAMEEVSHNPQTRETVYAQAEETPDLLVYGFLENSPRLVTLVDCMTVGRNEVLGGLMPLRKHRLQAKNIIRGAHVSGPSEPFTGVRVRVGDIDTWASLPGFKREDLTKDKVAISLQLLKLPPVETSKGAKLSLIEDVESSYGSLVESHMTRAVWIQAESFGDLTLQEIDLSYASPIVSYLSFVLGASSPLTAVQVKSGDNWLEVRHGGMRADPGQRVQQADVLLPLHVAGLDVLSQFLDVYEETGPAAPVIADLLRYGRSPNLETQVLELTTLAEGVHQRLFPQDIRMSEEDADRLRGLVASAIAEEENRLQQIVNGGLEYLEEASYKQRLKRLVKEITTAMPGACGRENRWVNSVYNARNSFAHRKQGFLKKEDIDEFFIVSQSLRWILMGILLLRSGITIETLSARVSGNQQYQLFLEQMRSAFPYIYGD